MAGGPCAVRTVRLQAEARRARRPADSRVVHQGQTVRVHEQLHRKERRQAAGHAAANSPAMARRGRVGQRAAAASRRRLSMTSPSSARVATDVFNHAPAKLFMNTGSTQFGRPSMGVVGHLRHRQRVAESARLCRAAIRPARARAAGRSTGPAASCPRSYQGVPLRSVGEPILDLRHARGHRRRPPGAIHSTRSAN